jgi:hypothetical protein
MPHSSWHGDDSGLPHPDIRILFTRAQRRSSDVVVDGPPQRVP